MDRLPGDRRGGIAGLGELLARHGAPVEADLARYYGVHLGDLGTADLSWRRLRVLLAHLPPDSATAQAIHGPAAAWSPTEHLLASVVDRLGLLLWANGGGKGAKPDPVPRPGSAEAARLKARRTRLTPDQLADRLVEQRARTARQE